jgi:hypothetical protein
MNKRPKKSANSGKFNKSNDTTANEPLLNLQKHLSTENISNSPQLFSSDQRSPVNADQYDNFSNLMIGDPLQSQMLARHRKGADI